MQPVFQQFRTTTDNRRLEKPTGLTEFVGFVYVFAFIRGNRHVDLDRMFTEFVNF